MPIKKADLINEVEKESLGRPIKLIGFYQFDKSVNTKKPPFCGRLASVKFEN